MNVLAVIVIGIISFLAGATLLGKRRETEWDDVLRSLRKVKETGAEILVKPSGRIAGLIPPNSWERWHDERFDVDRERYRFLTLDGEETTEPRDAFNKKTGKPENIVPIEQTGGVALTELTNPGEELTTIRKGPQIQRLKNRADENETAKQELSRIREKQRKQEREMVAQITKNNNLQRERDDLEEDLEHFRTANERLRRQYETWRQIALGVRAEANQLRNELERIAEGREEFAEIIKPVLEDAREFRLSKAEVPGVEEVGEEELEKFRKPETEEEEAEVSE
nr:hypothetical protein [uncultured archaeon]